tara:strand:+ start:175 stop:2337 length:2163 start_codon:yes stop_codon:yes gene_type:complete
VSDTTADNGFLTKSLTADDLASYVTARVNLNFLGDTGTGVVNLDTQNLSITGTANEIETAASSQTIQIGLPDNVTITNNLTVGQGVSGNLIVGDSGSQSQISGYLNLGEVFVADTLEVDGDTTLNNDLDVSGNAEIGGSLNMTLSRINNVLDPTQPQDAATKQYVDTAVTGLLEFKGTFRADTGEILSGTNAGFHIYNCPGGAGSRVGFNTGDYYIVSSFPGQFYCSGPLLQTGDSILATRDRAAGSSVISDWATLEGDNVEGTGLNGKIPLWTDTQTLGVSNINQDPISGNISVSAPTTISSTLNVSSDLELGADLLVGGGTVLMGGGTIEELAPPVDPQDATNKAYVDGLTSTNASNISTNASNISANTTSIQTNATNIATNTTDIATNASDIAGIAPNVATNAQNIATNATNIATNSAGISTNANAITGKVDRAGDTMSGDLSIVSTTGNPVLTVNNVEPTGTNFQAAIVSLRATETITNTVSRGTITIHGPNSLNTGGAGNLVIENKTVAGGQVVIASKDAATTYFNRFKTNGQVQFEQYGSGTLTGTATRNISVDASGNLIETPVSVTTNTTLINGLVNNLASAGSGSFDFMEWVSNITSSTQIPVMKTPRDLVLKSVSYSWMGDTALSIGVGEQVAFTIGTIPSGSNPVIANYTSAVSLFDLTNADDGTYANDVVTGLNQNFSAGDVIAVVGQETGTVTPNSGELSLTFEFEVS